MGTPNLGFFDNNLRCAHLEPRKETRVHLGQPVFVPRFGESNYGLEPKMKGLKAIVLGTSEVLVRGPMSQTLGLLCSRGSEPSSLTSRTRCRVAGRRPSRQDASSRHVSLGRKPGDLRLESILGSQKGHFSACPTRVCRRVSGPSKAL